MVPKYTDWFDTFFSGPAFPLRQEIWTRLVYKIPSQVGTDQMLALKMQLHHVENLIEQM